MRSNKASRNVWAGDKWEVSTLSINTINRSLSGLKSPFLLQAFKSPKHEQKQRRISVGNTRPGARVL